MKTLKTLTLLLIVLIFASCQPSKDKVVRDITEKEKTIYSGTNPIPDKTKVEELITLYKKFAEEFSDDSLAPEYLYKGATLLMNSEQNDEAINLLDRIFKDYPSFNKLPEALFLKAFIYENNIKNINKAREAYKDFLNKYPDSDLADDAKISLENLGKTPEQIIKEFEQKMKQQEDSLAAATAKK